MLPPGEDKAAPLFLLACLSTAVITLATVLCCRPGSRLVSEAVAYGSPGLVPMALACLGARGRTGQVADLLVLATEGVQDHFSGAGHSLDSRLRLTDGRRPAGLGGAGLVGGAILADSLAAVFLARGALVQGRALFAPCARWPVLRRMAWEYRQFAVYGCPQNVINALSQGIPVLSLAHYYGAAVAGSYAFGLRLLLAPMNFILTSVRQVLYQRLSRVARPVATCSPPFSSPPACSSPSAFRPVASHSWPPARLRLHFRGALARSRRIRPLARFLAYPRVLQCPFHPCGAGPAPPARPLLVDVALLCARAAALVLGGSGSAAAHDYCLQFGGSLLQRSVRGLCRRPAAEEPCRGARLKPCWRLANLAGSAPGLSAALVKITCLIDYLEPGGAQRQLVSLGLFLKRMGHDVSFVTYHDGEFFQRQLEQAGIPIRRVRPRHKLLRAIAIRKALRFERPHAVLAFLEGPCFYAEIASLPFRRWGLVVSERLQIHAKKPPRDWKRVMHLRADYVTTNSHANRLALERMVPSLGGRVATIYNCLDLSAFCPSEASPTPTPDTIKLVVMASYLRRKNTLGLAKALALAREKDPGSN